MSRRWGSEKKSRVRGGRVHAFLSDFNPILVPVMMHLFGSAVDFIRFYTNFSNGRDLDFISNIFRGPIIENCLKKQNIEQFQGCVRPSLKKLLRIGEYNFA